MTHDSKDGSTSETSPPHLRFSTEAEPASLQFDAWRTAMEGSIDVRRPELDANRPGFAASVDAWNLGGIGLLSMTLPGEGHERRWHHQARVEADHWSLIIPIADGSGRIYRTRPLSFGSMARPLSGSGSDTRVMSLFLPRDLFSEAAERLDRRGEAPLDRGMTALLVDFVQSLERQLSSGASGLHGENLISAVHRMALAGLAPTADRVEQARSLLQARLAERIKQHIRQNLAAPDLGWSALAARFGLSRSTLHRLLEPEGGVWNFIRRERLRAVYRELEECDGRETIAALAERYGFNDPSGFSRAFRHEFGHSPRDVTRRSHGLDEAGDDAFSPLPPIDRFLLRLREAGQPE